jgi:hypothetical protein
VGHDEHTHAAGIHELERAQVEDDLVTRLDRRHELLLELRGGGQIELATHQEPAAAVAVRL